MTASISAPATLTQRGDRYRPPRLRSAFRAGPSPRARHQRAPSAGLAGIALPPPPSARAEAARDDALAIDRGHDIPVARQQRLGGAHLGAQRQLALGQAVAAVLLELHFLVLLRPAGAEGALVHLAARAEIGGLRILRRSERAGVEAIAAADAQILVVQHDAFLGLIEAVDRADGRARRIRAVHAGNRDRALARLAVVDGDDAAPVDTPRHLMLV